MINIPLYFHNCEARTILHSVYGQRSTCVNMWSLCVHLHAMITEAHVSTLYILQADHLITGFMTCGEGYHLIPHDFSLGHWPLTCLAFFYMFHCPNNSNYLFSKIINTNLNSIAMCNWFFIHCQFPNHMNH